MNPEIFVELRPFTTSGGRHIAVIVRDDKVGNSLAFRNGKPAGRLCQAEDVRPMFGSKIRIPLTDEQVFRNHLFVLASQSVL